MSLRETGSASPAILIAGTALVANVNVNIRGINMDSYKVLYKAAWSEVRLYAYYKNLDDISSCIRSDFLHTCRRFKVSDYREHTAILHFVNTAVNVLRERD